MASQRSAVVLFLALAGAVTSAASAGAQEVRGMVTADAAGTPLAGAHVVLFDESGGRVNAVLSGSDGVFTFTVPAPGPYRVRSESMGRRTAETAVDVPPEGASITLESSVQGVDTDLPRIRTDRGCAISPEMSSRVAALWAEVGKALRVVEWSQSSGRVQLETETWYRELDPKRLRVTDEGRTARPGFHATGRLPSPPAAELAARGFIWGGEPGEAITFHGPDAGTLLSAAFVATHCMGFDPSGPEDGWVGLTFEPTGRGGKDVEGTLWIDAATGSPHRLEYRYTSLPWPVKTDKAGGGMELARMSDGAWIVQRWWLRMPRVGVREQRITQWDPPRKKFTLTGLVEEGGQVVRVRLTDGRVEEVTPGA